MTHHTTGLVQIQFPRSMAAEETGHMAGGFERGVLEMALLAAKGIIDFGVAYQTICHLGHGGWGDMIGLR